MTRETLLLLAALCGTQCIDRAAKHQWTRVTCVRECAEEIDTCITRIHGRRFCRHAAVSICRLYGPKGCSMIFPP